MKKKTIVYIDGYNLYYGLLKGTAYKWLDLLAFARQLLPDDHEVIAVKYFTSCTLTYPHDNAAVERQNVYLQALLSFAEVKVISGFFKKNKVLMPIAEAQCKECDVPQNGLVRVVRLEEKRSDVNLAVEMMVDAAQSDVECLVVVTLKRAASYYKNIPRDLPAQCQLPETVTLANGRSVHRPPAWR